MSDFTVASMEQVSFAYEHLPVLCGVNLSVPAGAFMSVLGPNGGGKTTLLKLLLGLLKPDQGKIKLFGQDPEFSRQRVGYVPQHLHFDPQFPITVKDVVLMGRLGFSATGWFSHQDHLRVQAALDEMDLKDYQDRSLAALSGGQRQRVLIARALASDPELLLLDEPTASVDLPSEKKLSEILAGLNQRMTILIVSHDLGFVSSLVQKVICVNRRVSVHPTEELSGDLIHQLYQGDMHLVCHQTNENQPGVSP